MVEARSAVCVRVCVVIPFILDVKHVDVPAGITQDFSTFLCGTFLNFYREKDSVVPFVAAGRCTGPHFSWSVRYLGFSLAYYAC